MFQKIAVPCGGAGGVPGPAGARTAGARTPVVGRATGLRPVATGIGPVKTGIGPVRGATVGASAGRRAALAGPGLAGRRVLPRSAADRQRKNGIKRGA